jgi:hypothetical protein
MSLCCATVLVAGTVASAADNSTPRAAQPAVKVEAKAGVGSAREAIRNWNVDAANFGFGGSCADCPGWFNGAWDNQNGQGSHEGGGNMCGSKAADDFYLCEGYIYELRSIRGTLITDSIIRRARLELYDDCNGCPGNLLYTFNVFEQPVTTGASLGDGFFTVEYNFVVANQGYTCPYIRLKGGTYWVSVIGLTDGQGTDQSFFATTGNGVIKGSVAKKISGICIGHWNLFSYSSCSIPTCCWDSLEDCCIGCTDLAFQVCADSCKILIDNGGAASPLAGNRSERSSGSNRNSRAADDFVVPPCQDLEVCYVEGCIFTNCNIAGHCDCGFFEIYGNDCDEPAYDLVSTVPADRTRLSNNAVNLGFTVQQVINGSTQTLTAWRLEFHDLSGICLPQGRQYWISIGLDYTFTFLERAYFCYNADCRRTCLVRFNPGHYRSASDTAWISTGNKDYSFLIAVENCTATPGGATPSCAADFDNDGQATINDIFAFLATWFAGCP